MSDENQFTTVCRECGAMGAHYCTGKPSSPTSYSKGSAAFTDADQKAVIDDAKLRVAQAEVATLRAELEAAKAEVERKKGACEYLQANDPEIRALARPFGINVNVDEENGVAPDILGVVGEMAELLSTTCEELEDAQVKSHELESELTATRAKLEEAEGKLEYSEKHQWQVCKMMEHFRSILAIIKNEVRNDSLGYTIEDYVKFGIMAGSGTPPVTPSPTIPINL